MARLGLSFLNTPVRHGNHSFPLPFPKGEGKRVWQNPSPLIGERLGEGSTTQMGVATIASPKGWQI